MPAFDTNLLAKSIMPAFDTNLLAKLSGQLVRELVDLRDPVRAPRLVPFRDLRYLAASARSIQPPGLSVDETLEFSATRLAAAAIPTAPDGLLSDDLADLNSWVSQVMSSVLEVSGLRERDLLEDGVATCVYVMTFCLVLALLVQFPLMETIAGLTGALPAHGSGVVASRLGRRSLRSLEEL